MEASGKRYVLHRSRADTFTLWNLVDIHYGNKACALSRVKADIDRIRRDPFALWLGGGDYAEYISVRDRRFDADTITRELQIADLGRLGRALSDKVRDLFWPIRDKCLGLLHGNHETVYQREKEQQSLHAELCASLGVPNLAYSALLDLCFVRMSHIKKPVLQRYSPRPRLGTRQRGNTTSSFRVYIHHGAGFANTPGGKLTRLVQFMQIFDADIYFVGHVHDQIGRREERIGANAACDKIISATRVGVISGSYLKTYEQGVTTYGEVKAYAPTTLGAAFVKICPETREIKGEI